jgi:uncharacterized protein
MRVAITGGSGYMGTALRQRLVADGHEAFAVRRGPASDPAAQWDPAGGWVRPGAFEGVDAVVHLSGTSIGAKRWTASRRAELRASRIDSTRALVDHLGTLRERPRVLISMSAIGYYQQAGATELREDGPRGQGFLADLVADWEAEAMRASALGIRTVTPRMGPTIARDSELMQRLLLPFRLGLGGPLGSGRQWFSWISTEDAVGGLAFMLEHEELSGPVNLVAPGAVTNLEFTRALGRVLHRPTVFPVPAPALRLVFGSALTNEAVLSDQRVVPARLLEAGYRFAFPRIEAALDAHLGGRAKVAAA